MSEGKVPVTFVFFIIKAPLCLGYAGVAEVFRRMVIPSNILALTVPTVPFSIINLSTSPRPL